MFSYLFRLDSDFRVFVFFVHVRRPYVRYWTQRIPSFFRKFIGVYCNSAQALSFSPQFNRFKSLTRIFFLFFRLERERLSEKLRQKEVLERELSRERAALQEQLIKQAKLNEIIRQKDLFEKELRKEKNELQVT